MIKLDLPLGIILSVDVISSCGSTPTKYEYKPCNSVEATDAAAAFENSRCSRPRQFLSEPVDVANEHIMYYQGAVTTRKIAPLNLPTGGGYGVGSSGNTARECKA